MANRFWERFMGGETPAEEKSESPDIHRYGQVTVVGKKVESPENIRLDDGEKPLVLLRQGKNQESSLYQGEEVRFNNRDINHILITSRLPKEAGNGKLAIGIPLTGEGAETGGTSMFSMEMDRQKREITALQLDAGLEFELRDRSGNRYIFKGDRSSNASHDPIFEIYDPRNDSWKTESIALNDLIIVYADTILVRQPAGDKVRQISAQLFFGSEGSGIHLNQKQLNPTEAASREILPATKEMREKEQQYDAAIQAWLDGLRGDRDIVVGLLQKYRMSTAKLETYLEKDVEESFIFGIGEARQKIINNPRKIDRIRTTLQEVDWAGTPAVYTGEDGSILPKKYFEVFLEENPDGQLFYWALDATVRQGEENTGAFVWDMTPNMFPTQEEYAHWKKVFDANKYKLQSLAVDMGLPDLEETQLKLFALTLRLGISGRNPYVQTERNA